MPTSGVGRPRATAACISPMTTAPPAPGRGTPTAVRLSVEDFEVTETEPGVQGDRYSEEGGATANGRTGGVNVHGNRSLQNNFLLDGVDNNSISTNVQELSTQVSRPSIDSIEEFKVVTSPYSAEYGRSPGAAISVTTKSGTNAFRGAAYDYYRDDRFDSNSYFNEDYRTERGLAPNPKFANDQNQFGASLGGPIVKDKAFFFVDYEGTRITKGVTRIINTPTLDQREVRGEIDESHRRDPLTGQPFPGNVIPASRIDPVAKAIFDLMPAPNTPGANNYTRPDAQVTDDADRFLGRVDLRLSGSDNIFARYIYTTRQRVLPGYLGGIIDGTSSSALGDQSMKSHGLVMGWTKILGPSLVNEFRFSFIKAFILFVLGTINALSSAEIIRQVFDHNSGMVTKHIHIFHNMF